MLLEGVGRKGGDQKGLCPGNDVQTPLFEGPRGVSRLPCKQRRPLPSPVLEGAGMALEAGDGDRVNLQASHLEQGAGRVTGLKKRNREPRCQGGQGPGRWPNGLESLLGETACLQPSVNQGGVIDASLHLHPWNTCPSLLLSTSRLPVAWGRGRGAGRASVAARARARGSLCACVQPARRARPPEPSRSPPARRPTSSQPPTRSVLTQHSQPAARPAQPSPARLPLPPLKVSLEPGYPERWVSEDVLFLQHPPPSPYLIRAETRFSKLRAEKVAAGLYYQEKERGAATTVNIRFFPARCRGTD